MTEWLPPVLGLIGVALGAGITIFIKWMEGREKYQVMTFEKRLLAHQEAFTWTTKLQQAIISEDKERIDNTAEKLSVWWENNCLFLDENSRISMIIALNCAYAYGCVLGAIPKNEEVYTFQKDALESSSTSRGDIVTGIGAKHLPELKRKP